MESKNSEKLLNLEGLNLKPGRDSDLRAEVVAAALIEKGYSPDKIVISRDGAGKRGYSSDISKVSLEYSRSDKSDYLQISCNREGIYDILPEGVFHRTVNKRLSPDREDMLEEIRIHREEEFLARKFFRPFEMELDGMLTDLALFEAEFDKRLSYPKYVRVFRDGWQLINLLDREQAVLFLHTLPFLHRIRDSFAETGEAMSLILGVPVCPEKIMLAEKDTDSFSGSELGKCRLGIDLIAGTAFNDGLYDVKLKTGPMSALKMKAFLKGEPFDLILTGLCRTFLPCNIFTVREYILEPEDSVFILSTGETDTWLGINSYI